MTLHTLTTLAISSHAAAVATRAVASLPERVTARCIQRAGRAELEAQERWKRLGRAIVGKRRVSR